MIPPKQIENISNQQDLLENILLTEVRKALHNKNSPLNIEIPIINPEQRSARSKSNGRLINKGFSNGTKSIFINRQSPIFSVVTKNIL